VTPAPEPQPAAWGGGGLRPRPPQPPSRRAGGGSQTSLQPALGRQRSKLLGYSARETYLPILPEPSLDHDRSAPDIDGGAGVNLLEQWFDARGSAIRYSIGAQQAVAWGHCPYPPPRHTRRLVPPCRSPTCGSLICCTVPLVFYTQTAFALYTCLCYHGAHRGGNGYGSHEYRFG
jgi:hypothetical protein